MRCKDCGATLHHEMEKALSGESQGVLIDESGAWVCEETGQEHKPGPFQLTAKEAIDLGIFAVNTWMHPDASTPLDIERLERLAEDATTVLAEIREWVIAQGEDFENRLDQDREVVVPLDQDTTTAEEAPHE